MKILQLNIWTGRIKGSLEKFFQNNSYDIICLQEAVWSDNLLLENFCFTVDQIKSISDLKYDFRSANWEINAFDTTVKQGNVILSNQPLLKKDSYLVHGEYSNIKSLDDKKKKQGYTLQIAQIENGLNIINHHGYWQPTPMGNHDTVNIMKKISKIVQNLNTPIVMCGDLNISHEAPAMRELDFLSDLTHKYNIENTLMGLKFDGKVACDHILVSKDVKVKSFQVLNDLLSDHKALSLEI